MALWKQGSAQGRRCSWSRSRPCPACSASRGGPGASVGEIADALRRARRSRPAEGRDDPQPQQGSALGEVLRRARENAGGSESPAAPPPLVQTETQTETRVERGATSTGAREAPPSPADTRRERPRPAEPPPPSLQATPASRTVEVLQPTSPAIVVDDSSAVHQCRNLALRVRGVLEQRGAASVAVTSAVPQEGKTTVLCNLALALASLSGPGRVALLDLDLRKPSAARVLGLRVDQGVDQVLIGAATLDDVRIRVERPSVDVYPAGDPHHGAHQLLGGASLGELIAELERRYSLVLVDTPPALLVPDTHLILQHVSACIPVVRAGHSRARPFKQLMASLPRSQTLGALLNGNRPPRYTSYVYAEGADVDAPPASAALDPANR